MVFRTLRLLTGGSLASAAGWLLLAGILGHHAWHYGTRWVFGPHLMPHTLVSAADPTRYPDGTPIDPVTLTLVRSGREEQFFAGVAVIVVGGLAVNAWLSWRLYHRRKTRGLARLQAEYLAQTGHPLPLCPRHRHH